MTIRQLNDENKLIKQCLENNRRAQQLLFNQYKDAMYTLAYRITGNHNDAEDTLQEGFLNTFLKLDTYKGESTLGAWIKTIMVRTAIKKSKAQFVYEDIENYNREGELMIDDSLSGKAIEEAILNLNKGYRTVFILSEVEGYKHKEIAEVLKISEGTSKSQLFHAKKQLRKVLNDYQYNY